MAHFLYLVAEATTTSSSSYVAAFFVVLWLRRVVRRFRTVCAVGCVLLRIALPVCLVIASHSLVHSMCVVSLRSRNAQVAAQLVSTL